MKINWKLLVICIAVPLAVGFLSSFLTRGGTRLFETIQKPVISPPAWLFPVVWTILYTLMGISSYLILTSNAEKEKITEAISVYAYQLTVNFLWPTLFFSFQWFFVSFLWIVLLIFLVAAMIRKFYEIRKLSAYLNIPYLVWLCFAAYLNLAIWWMN